MKDDLTLLRCYATDGSNESFAELVKRHIDFVYATALRYAGSAHRAEEVAQTVFTDLARKARSLLGRRELVGWLYISTHYAAVTVVRSEVRRKTREQEAHMLQVLSSASGAALDWDKLNPLLDSALRDLNDTDRSAILLRYFKRCSFAEVGASLSVTEDAARKRVDRALDKLHQLLTKRGITSTAAALATLLTNQPVVAAPLGWASSVSTLALASAAAGGGAAGVTLWSFLTSVKTLTGTAGAIALIAIGTFVYQQTQAGAESVASASSSEVTAGDLASRAPSLEAETGSVEKSDSPAAQKRAARRAAKARSVKRSAAAITSTATVLSAEEVHLERERDTILRRYGPLYQKLNLTSEQRGRMTQLLLDRRETSADFAAASARSGEDVTRDHELFDASVDVLRDNIFGQINQLLGDEGYAKFLETETSIQQAGVVERLKKKMARTRDVLTNGQAEQLQHTLEDLHLRVIDGTVIERASGFLSPPQIAGLRELQARRALGAQKNNIQQAVQENLPKNLPSP